MKYKLSQTNEYKKDLKRALKRGCSISALRDVLLKLANGEKLDEKYKDHKLVNSKNFINCRELHIQPDWLLIYRIEEDKLLLVLTRTGIHSDLF